MVEKKRFLLRIDPDLHAALERWAADDLRSINGQIEFVLKEAVRAAGRIKDRPTDPYRSSDDDDG
ncbi:toxin-antitoxin system HicB family antitoxin [Nannocystis radixulma]|uniref:Toxin-antitoxin system HicB family antitoxin n=1 Tax=Nannocystis radixulma TaxID=2995305 RepID=A0ABT5B0M5_9BACT|nr:toxin-antitoxin system HicB family antitoxin [Nannocystis radixulma]MDC0667655.1 toxin-antitoxin system HicB family antitoxin [Nannocystis radixulma]